MARPMPRVLPVTKAVLPVRSMVVMPCASSRNASTSSAVPSVTAVAPGTIRLSSPASTLPGPISRNRAPGTNAAAPCMQATQRTGAVS